MHYRLSKGKKERKGKKNKGKKKDASVVPGNAVGRAACLANTVKSSLREETRLCAASPLL